MHLRRPLRRTLALAAGTVVLTVPLTSCGFDYATDRPYTPAAGMNNQAHDVKVLNAVIVAAHEGSGTFAAGLANDTEDEVTLAAVTSLEGVEAEFEPISIPSGGYVNLAEEGTVHVTGDVVAGQVIELTLEFASGDEIDVRVPVVTNCDEFEGVDTSEGSGEAYSCEIPEDADGGEGGH